MECATLRQGWQYSDQLITELRPWLEPNSSRGGSPWTRRKLAVRELRELENSGRALEVNKKTRVINNKPVRIPLDITAVQHPWQHCWKSKKIENMIENMRRFGLWPNNHLKPKYFSREPSQYHFGTIQCRSLISLSGIFLFAPHLIYFAFGKSYLAPSQLEPGNHSIQSFSCNPNESK